MREFWNECQRQRPDGFDNVGWFILCAGIIALIFRSSPFKS